MAYNPRDYYYHKAKDENFAARSVFKLQEIDDRFKLLKAGQIIIDLGCAPGSWSQYASQKVGPKGRVLGVDLQPVKLTIPNALFIAADLRSLELEKTFAECGISPPFDIVLSDMAPKTTGVKITDQVRSMELCELALSVADRFAKPKGSHFVAKLFHSDEFEKFRKMLIARYSKVEVLRPKSTRTGSKEIFLIGINRRDQAAHSQDKAP
jgi:23S rRNA (uridine2552-2'-O)-methyltransferase